LKAAELANSGCLKQQNMAHKGQQKMSEIEFTAATVLAKANIYFEGKVISHTVITSAGERKTLGVILPGEYKFDTGVPERMDITHGACEIQVAGAAAGWSTVKAGSGFDVPGKSYFVIRVKDACQYICSFLG
jgi:purine/pyrimidine-nucleoside phosphorylase